MFLDDFRRLIVLARVANDRDETLGQAELAEDGDAEEMEVAWNGGLVVLFDSNKFSNFAKN